VLDLVAIAGRGFDLLPCRTRSAAAAGRSRARCACAASRAEVVRRVGLGQFEAQALERRLDFGQVRGGGRLAVARVGEPRAGRLDRLAESAVALRELDLLPAAQLSRSRL
jgi:hypothetical protein